PIWNRGSGRKINGIAPAPFFEDGARRNGPAAIAATVNPLGQTAGAIAKLFAFWLAEIQVITTGRGFSRKTLWHRFVAAEGLEGYDSIGSAGMAIQIHNKEIAAAQLDAGHRARVGIPPSLELSRVGGCGLAPSGDGRLLVQFLRRVVPRHQGRKDED